MENFGFLIAVTVYLGILTLAVGWFLLPRWVYGAKAMMIEKARLERHALDERSDAATRYSQAHSGWNRSRWFPDSRLR